MTDWLDPEQVKAWLAAPKEDPVKEQAKAWTEYYNRVDAALEQFVRAMANMNQEEQVHVGQPPSDCWFCRESDMLKVARLIVEALDD